MKNKLIIFLVSFVIFSEMLTIRAYAYIDVSATTYIIQIVAGAVVALGAVVGVVVSRIKKKAKEKFNIDLDRKEQEEDVVVYSDDTENK